MAWRDVVAGFVRDQRVQPPEDAVLSRRMCEQLLERDEGPGDPPAVPPKRPKRPRNAVEARFGGVAPRDGDQVPDFGGVAVAAAAPDFGGLVEQQNEPYWPSAYAVYPGRPGSALVDALASLLLQWVREGESPVAALRPMDGFTQLTASRDVIEANAGAIRAALATAVAGADRAALREAVALMGGSRGVATLLGMRETAGSVVRCPPPTRDLWRAFWARHSTHSRSRLTVGARALAKHCHRGAEGWWGSAKGSDAVVNQLADRKLAQILEAAVWINAHALPDEKIVLEVRCAEGYGARWQLGPLQFRGFVEPYMEDGHEVGWRH